MVTINGMTRNGGFTGFHQTVKVSISMNVHLITEFTVANEGEFLKRWYKCPLIKSYDEFARLDIFARTESALSRLTGSSDLIHLNSYAC